MKQPHLLGDLGFGDSGIENQAPHVITRRVREILVPDVITRLVRVIQVPDVITRLVREIQALHVIPRLVRGIQVDFFYPVSPAGP